MIDREKVIKGLEKVWNAFNCMEHELYADYVYDALALLKADQAELIRQRECIESLEGLVDQLEGR